MAWLLPGPRHVGGIALNVHTMLYAAVGMLVGFQSVLFAILSKVFAMTAGLAPWTPNLRKLFRKITLETGLLAGGAMVLAGLLTLLGLFLYWWHRSFAALDLEVTLRVAIPGVVTMAVGFQTIMASFLLSIMGLARVLPQSGGENPETQPSLETPSTIHREKAA